MENTAANQFSFSPDGFSIHQDGDTKNIQWNDIESLLAFKEDLITHDLIYLDIFCSDHFSLRISEETPGWNDFLTASKEAFPSITRNWEEVINLRPFVTNFTVVFDKQNRSPKELMKLYYNN